MVKISVPLTPCGRCNVASMENFEGTCIVCKKTICQKCGYNSPKYGCYCKDCLSALSEKQQELIISSGKRAKLFTRILALSSLGFLIALAAYAMIFAETSGITINFLDPTFITVELILLAGFLVTFALLFVFRNKSKPDPLPNI